jgi:hypothetical protein
VCFDAEERTVTTDGTERREQGIEFGDLDRALAAHEYLTTTAEVLDVHGEHRLTIPDGTRTLREVLKPLDDGKHDVDTTETACESAEEVRQMIFNAVGSDAIGRQEYSDRDHETREEAERRGKESF